MTPLVLYKVGYYPPAGDRKEVTYVFVEATNPAKAMEKVGAYIIDNYNLKTDTYNQGIHSINPAGGTLI